MLGRLLPGDTRQFDDRLLRTAFIIFIGLVFGPITVSVVRWLQKRQFDLLIWMSLTAASFGLTGLWLMWAPEFDGSNRQAIMVMWGVSPIWAPLLTLVVEGIVFMAKITGPRTLQEQLDEEARYLEQRRRSISRWAGQQIERVAPTSTDGLLTLGLHMKGDVFPDYLGVHRQRGNWLGIDEQLLAQHMLVVGTTGAGKTQTLLRLIEETLANTNRDVYVIDGKGEAEFALAVANLIYANGRGSVPVFTLGHDGAGSIYNGFRGGKREIFNRLAAMVGVERAEGNAEYYADINRLLLQLLCYAPEGPPRDFEEVEDRLNQNWLAMAYKGNPRRLRAIDELKSGDIQGLLKRIRPLVYEFEDLVGQEGFVLEETRGAVFSLRVQSVGDTARRFLRFLIEDVKDFVGKRQQRPGLLVIDEFGVFDNHNITDLLKLARSANLGVVLATQTVASLGEERIRQEILENTRTKLLMASDFPQDIAALAGTIYQIETSLQHSEGESTGLGSARVQHAFRVDMNEAARLQAGEAFLIRQRYASKLKIKPIGRIEQRPEAIAYIEKQQRIDSQDKQVPDLDL